MSLELSRQERQGRILDLLDGQGRASVATLSEHFGPSEATPWPKLCVLVQEGLIVCRAV
jgi:DeoR/GlpR family transcriptional regulator of sugar metabolism